MDAKKKKKAFEQIKLALGNSTDGRQMSSIKMGMEKKVGQFNVDPAPKKII